MEPMKIILHGDFLAYAYWYGWNMMTEDLGEVKELAKTMRAIHKK
jgi:hypothetical protein